MYYLDKRTSGPHAGDGIQGGIDRMEIAVCWLAHDYGLLGLIAGEEVHIGQRERVEA